MLIFSLGVKRDYDADEQILCEPNNDRILFHWKNQLLEQNNFVIREQHSSQLFMADSKTAVCRYLACYLSYGAYPGPGSLVSFGHCLLIDEPSVALFQTHRQKCRFSNRIPKTFFFKEGS